MSTTTQIENDLTASDRICVALDNMDAMGAWRIAEQLKNKVGWLKIGMELFTLGGPKFLGNLKTIGHRIFLDLKYHDIPNTVYGAVTRAAENGVAMLNVHAAGGPEMLKAAAEAAMNAKTTRKPLVIGVTFLTSLSDDDLNNFLGFKGTSQEFVLKMAKACFDAGLAGVVASPNDAKVLREEFGPDFIIVTPGIRPLWAGKKGDQKRVSTPSRAIGDGSSLLVIGRPIHGADNPVVAVKKISDEIAEALRINIK